MDQEVEGVEDQDEVQQDDDTSQADDQQGTSAADDSSGDEGLTITLGDEQPDPEEQEAAPWVRELRKKQQATVRENRELKAEIDRLKATSAPPKIEVGDEPTLEACEYDEAKFKQAWRDWNTRKAKAEAAEQEHKQAATKEKEAWDARVTAYQTAKAKLAVKDFADAEAAVMASFDVNQQGILLLAKQPEMMMYALGKNDAERARLAGIKNYGEFAIAVGELMTKLKVTPGKSKPLPERRIAGQAPGSAGSGGSDRKLAELEKEADRTGDRTAVAAYRRQMARATT